MRVLLTGHKGFIGAVIAPLFTEAGHEVVGLDSGLFDNCHFASSPASIPEVPADLRDVLPEQLDGFDAVVHLAGLSNDALGELNPELTFDINYRASVRLARIARDAGVSRFVFSSSCSTYGAAGDLMLDETAAFNPVTAYAESKVLVEQEVAKLADDGFSPVYLRNATAYGASSMLRMDLVVNDLVASAITTGRVLLMSDGTPWRPLVHAEDIGRAMVACLEAPRETVHNRAFNVGQTHENYQMRDVAEIVQQTVPHSRIEYAANAGPDKRCYRVSFEKIRQEIPGFQPRWNVRSGAEQLYEQYKAHGLGLEDYQGSRYRRVRHLRALLSSGSLDSQLRWTSKLPEQPPSTGVAAVGH